MTKIYIYCLFDKDGVLEGVYSSLKAVHRDAIKLCNHGLAPVRLVYGENKRVSPTMATLRNVFKGEIDTTVSYVSDSNRATVLKTKLKE